jgi:predicted NAD/FAD-dependent oxidoreductase
MSALVRRWAEPLAASGQLVFETRVIRMEADKLDARRWQLQTEGPGDSARVYPGFDAVVLAVPSPQVTALLLSSQQGKSIMAAMADVTVAPCWTLMLAFPQAVQPKLAHLGPQWNAARSTHHRIAWLARESSKPGREQIERWTVQASPEWSERHLEDDAERVKAKLLKAFTEVTGIRAEPPYAEVHRWRYAQTTEPLGKTHLLDKKSNIGACGDWCLGHRVEDGFVSGLEMALALA